MRRLIVVIPVVLFAVVMIAFSFALHRDPSKIPSVLIDKPLPSFDLPAVHAGAAGLKSTEMRGEAKLLNVFASWCVACREEHSTLLELHRQGVPIDGLDWKDEAAAGAKYLDDNGDPYAISGNDRSGRTGIDLGVTGVPETFVIDRKGRVRYKFIGPIEADDWTNTLLPLLQKLKAES